MLAAAGGRCNRVRATRNEVEYVALRGEADRLEAELGDAQEALTALEDEVRRSADELADRAQQLDVGAKQLNRRADELHDLEVRLASLSTELDDRAARIDERESSVSAREADLTARESRPSASAGTTTGPAQAPAVSGVFENCSAARAAGAAPVHRGDPGYGPHLDRDGDGIGCE